MNREEYRAYLRSPAWRMKRDGKLFDAEYRCERCGYDGLDMPLDVHHLTYERVGNERDSDLIVLCRSCHEMEHKEDRAKIDRKTDEIFAQWVAEFKAKEEGQGDGTQ